jgi:signal peptidase II
MFENKYVRLAVIAGLVITADQITKWIILNHLPLFNSVVVIPGFFNLTHIHNPGGAFGFLSGQSSTTRHIMFVVVSMLATGLIFWFYYKTPRTHPYLAAGFALIFGGAIGNLIDRVRFGKVVDFLDFYFSGWHWPAFNVADSAITIGITIFVYHLIFKKYPDASA